MADLILTTDTLNSGRIKINELYNKAKEIENILKPNKVYLFNAGNEMSDLTGGWVHGFNTPTNENLIREKEDTFLRLSLVNGTQTGETGFVTADKVDVTNLAFLSIDWEQVGNSNSIRASLALSEVQKSPRLSGTNKAIVSENTPFDRKITTLDVSHLTGEYYIKIHSVSSTVNPQVITDVRVFNVYGVSTKLDKTEYLEYLENRKEDSNTKSSYPDYYKEELQQVKKQTQELQTGETITFAFITDTHGAISWHDPVIKNQYHAIREIAPICDFVFQGGDVIDGSKTLEIAKDTLNSISEIMYDLNTPVFVAKGNHDTNHYIDTSKLPLPEDTVDEQIWYSRNIKPFDKGFVHPSDNQSSSYYYKDFDNHKIRTIILDAVDYPKEVNSSGELVRNGYNSWGFGGEQLDWLSHEALNFENKDNKEDWSVVILSHMTPNQTHKNRGDTGVVLEGILNAFETGTGYSETIPGWSVNVDVDFSKQGAMNIIGYFAGHVHQDTSYLSPSQKWSYITTTRAYPDYPGEGDRAPGTINEAVFDLVTIDKKNKKIFMKRFGFGDDREFIF